MGIRDAGKKKGKGNSKSTFNKILVVLLRSWTRKGGRGQGVTKKIRHTDPAGRIGEGEGGRGREDAFLKCQSSAILRAFYTNIATSSLSWVGAD